MVPNKHQQDWMTAKWRPMMAMVYMAINICDFILFPILFTTVQFWETGASNDMFRQWMPMTVQGGGLIHMAFGAILGVAAWTRGLEKVASINNGFDPNEYTESSAQQHWTGQNQRYQQTQSYEPPAPYDTGDTVQTTTVQQTRTTPRRKII